MRSTIFVVGPTSVGKSEFALALAEQCGGEIINADAFQVYRGLDLLTAKPGPEDFARVPHHLYGIVPVGASYNAAQYARDARACLAEIHGRGRVALVVGGTGLYVKSLTHEMAPLPPPDPVLRTRLNALPLESLVAELSQVDPAAANQIDLQNPRRVVRALEICLGTGLPFAAHRESWNKSVYGPQQAGFYLFRDRDTLRARINARIERMFHEGVIEEVRSLPEDITQGTAGAAIGISDIQAYLDGRSSLAACIEAIQTKTRQYAKRQDTWFKRETIFRSVPLPIELSKQAELLGDLLGKLR